MYPSVFASDLAIVKIATGDAPYISGSVVTYTLERTNNGPNTTTATVSDIWPSEGITFLSATA